MQAKSNQDTVENTDLSRGLRRLLETRNWTQAELAQNLETSQSTISKLLNGESRPRPALKSRIKAQLLTLQSEDGVSGEWLTLVARAARKSKPFLETVNAALRLLNENE